MNTILCSEMVLMGHGFFLLQKIYRFNQAFLVKDNIEIMIYEKIKLK